MTSLPNKFSIKTWSLPSAVYFRTQAWPWNLPATRIGAEWDGCWTCASSPFSLPLLPRRKHELDELSIQERLYSVHKLNATTNAYEEQSSRDPLTMQPSIKRGPSRGSPPCPSAAVLEEYCRSLGTTWGQRDFPDSRTRTQSLGHV